MDYNEKKTERNVVIPTKLARDLSFMYSAVGKRCEHFERQWLNCASQLGVGRALEVCHDLRLDLDECTNNEKAMKRYQRIQEERQKQGKEYQDPPPYDTVAFMKFKAPIF